MRALLAVLGLVWRAERRALLRGAALSVLVLGAGAALLGLSGWFITAAAAAGLAGAGLVFDVFRPSAGVRLLALGRTAARYGERLFTHDATLRALAALRVRLLAGLARADWTRQERLRSAAALTRLTADVDALDAAPLRLALPLGAGLAAQGLAAAAVAWLADPAVALWILGANAAGAVGVALLGGRAASAHARRGEHALQALRLRTVDLVRGRADLAAAGLLAEQARAVAEATRRRAAAQARLDALERAAGIVLGLAVLAAAGGALLLGLAAVEAGRISPAQAAIGPFVALALGETLMPVRRAAAEWGRMRLAAGRVLPMLAEAPPAAAGEGEAAPGAAPPLVQRQTEAAPNPDPAAPLLRAEGLSFRREGAQRPLLSGVSLQLHAGETVGLSAPSGAGKSTLLLLLAGLLVPEAGAVCLRGRPVRDWPEPARFREIGLLRQRAALLRGTVAEGLRLAAPEAGEAEMRAALEAVALWGVLAPRGGLALVLGDRGAGLSGGEARRLALARAILRRPAVLLLDEPTEGLDPPTAAAVLAGIRAFLPRAAILIVSHRAEDLAGADRRLGPDSLSHP